MLASMVTATSADALDTVLNLLCGPSNVYGAQDSLYNYVRNVVELCGLLEIAKYVSRSGTIPFV